MKRDNVVLEKSKVFAIRIVKLYQYLYHSKYESVLSKQLLRSGTSIGANISESIYAISKKDFINKLFIALKEASETKYWLDLLYKTDYLTLEEYYIIEAEAIELIKLLTTIIKNTKNDQPS